jgi:hypothetical protein
MIMANVFLSTDTWCSQLQLSEKNLNQTFAQSWSFAAVDEEGDVLLKTV